MEWLPLAVTTDIGLFHLSIFSKAAVLLGGSPQLILLENTGYLSLGKIF